MQTSFTRSWFCVFCLALSMTLIPLSLAQDAAPSVLSRVQTVDDPELGELIRVALEQSRTREDEIKTVRAITESYAQIKLLDRQIEQIQQRIRSGVGSADLRHELLLAAAELESKRIMELANLREAMGIIPEHAFGRRSHWLLRTWIELDALDGQVHLLEHLQPFDQDNYRSVGLRSRTETLDYIRKLLAKSDALPIRIDIHRTTNAVELSEGLYHAVIDMVKQAGRHMQTEVHRDEVVRGDPWQFQLTLQPGVLSVPVSSYSSRNARASESVDPNALGAYLVKQLSKPGRLPAQLSIGYPASMREQADQLARTVEEALNGMGVTKLVQVTHRTWEPDPQPRYLGRWRAIDKSEVARILIGPRPNASITKIVTKDSGQTEQSHSANWSGDSRQISIRQGAETYNGYIDAEGNLVLGIANEPIRFTRAE